MRNLEILLIGIGLSMDAFAAALCEAMRLEKPVWKDFFLMAGLFGLFQALMPLTGWLLGTRFVGYISKIDHWIAFFLLALIGGKMIFEVFKTDDCPMGPRDRLGFGNLLMLAVATSIDALAAGITFAFLQVSILPAVAQIGCVTFVISLTGAGIGSRFGAKFKKKAELAGGVVLILIGFKILLEHLGVF